MVEDPTHVEGGDAMAEVQPSVDSVWKQMQERGVEFAFAQFVDM
jgi:hypothetical protein